MMGVTFDSSLFTATYFFWTNCLLQNILKSPVHLNAIKHTFYGFTGKANGPGCWENTRKVWKHFLVLYVGRENMRTN